MPAYTFKISRFHPDKSRRPGFRSYKVDLPEGATVLDGLIKVKDRKAPDLAFRRSCRSAICGSCAVRLNGKACLICDYQTSEAATDGVITLEPLAHFRVIRDLVVDLEPFWSAMEKALPWLAHEAGEVVPDEIPPIVPDEFMGLNHVDVCVLCAACHSDCRVFEESRDFPGPAYNIKTARFLLDPRDRDPDRAARAMEVGAGLCREPEICPVECPKEIDLHRRVLKVIKSAAGKSSG